MKIFNKIVWSKKEPVNKNDIWFDGSNFKIYTEGSWEIIIQNSGGGGNPSASLNDIRILYDSTSDDFTEEQRNYNKESYRLCTEDKYPTFIIEGMVGTVSVITQGNGEIPYVLISFKQQYLLGDKPFSIFFNVKLYEDGSVLIIEEDLIGSYDVCMLNERTQAELFFNCYDKLAIKGVLPHNGSLCTVDNVGRVNSNHYVEYNTSNKRYRVLFDKEYNAGQPVEIPIGDGGSVSVDDVLTDNSTNPVTSKGIKQYVDLHPQYEKVDEVDAPEIGLPSVVVDEQLSTTSTNPVQNKIITEELQRIQELAESGLKTITLYAPEITNMSGSGEENEAIIREFFTEEMIEHNKAALAVKDVRDSIIYVRGSEGALLYQGYIPKDWDGEASIDVFPMQYSGLTLVPAMLTIGDMIPEDTDTGDFDIGGLAVVVNYSSVDLRELLNSMDVSDSEFLLSMTMLVLSLLVTGITVTYDGEDLGLMAGIYGALDDAFVSDDFNTGICIPVIMSILHPNVFTGTLYIGSKDYIRWFPVNTTKYQDIADAALCGALIPNQKYTISDYETIVDSDVVRSSEFRHFNVVVTAKTRWELEETALATTRGTDEEKNVFTPIYGEFRLKYRLNPNKKDFPWITENAYIDIDNTAHPNSIFGTNTRFYKTPLVRYRNGEIYYMWLEKLEAEHWFNRVVKSLYTKVETPSVGDVAYTIEVEEEDAIFTITNVFVNENPNKGFIYEMEDMYGNQAPWDFFNLEFKAYEYSDGDYGFKRISFNGEKSGNSGESWYPTFYDSDLKLTGYNSSNLCNIRGEAYKEYNGIPVYFSFRNNKIYGHSKDGAVILTARETVERGDDAAITKYNMRLENVTINGGNIIAQMYCNSTINKGCNNLEIYAVSDESRLNECSINILSGVRGTPENPLVVNETFTYYAPFAYVGITSTGGIKIWNPADLVNI